MFRSMFQAAIYALARNAAIVVGRKAIEDGLTIAVRDMANEGVTDAQMAQSVLDRLGIQETATPSIPLPTIPMTVVAQPQTQPPTIVAAPSIQLASPNDNNKPDLRNGPGRPRKLHQEGGRS